MPGVMIDAALGTPLTAATMATSFTVTLASGTGTPGVGDLVVIVITNRGTGGAVNTPAGWTALVGSPFSHTTSATNRMYVFWRVRAAGDSNSVAFTATAGAANETFLAQAYYFGGIDPTTPIEVAAVKTESAATSATVAGPLTGRTSLTNDSMAVAIWHRADDAGTFSTASSGWTHNANTNAVVLSTLGTDAAMGIAWKRLPTAGASGTYQLDVATGTAVHWIGIVLILKAQTGTGLITLTAAGWSDEQAVTAQTVTDPYVAIVVGAGATAADNAVAPNFGGNSYRHTVVAQQQRHKINCDIPGTVQYWACIFTADAVPSASNRVGSLEGYDGTDHTQIQHQPDGGWRLAGPGGSPFSGLSTTKFAANVSGRLEYKVDTVAGTAELRIFSLADINNDIASPTETVTLTGLATTGLFVGRGMFGPGVANYASAHIWMTRTSIRYDNWVNLRVPSTPSRPQQMNPSLRGLLVR